MQGEPEVGGQRCGASLRQGPPLCPIVRSRSAARASRAGSWLSQPRICARSSALARRASSGVAERSACRRRTSCCNPTSSSSTAVGRPRPTRTCGSPRSANTAPRWHRSRLISRASRREGGAWTSRAVSGHPSAVAIACNWRPSVRVGRSPAPTAGWRAAHRGGELLQRHPAGGALGTGRAVPPSGGPPPVDRSCRSCGSGGGCVVTGRRWQNPPTSGEGKKSRPLVLLALSG